MARGMSLAALLSGIATVPDEIMVSGVSIDSRTITRGDLFLACKGHNMHGASFIKQAEHAGAVATALDTNDAPAIADVSIPVFAVPDLAHKAGVIASTFYDNPSTGLDVIGVTGTNGKTTVTLLLAHALNKLAGRDTACGVIGTLGHGIAGVRCKAENTTPDAVQVQALLQSFRQQRANYAVIEASSHSLAQHRLTGVRFSVAVLTQIGRDHLDYHASIEQYALCKRRLFQWPDLQVAVLNADDKYGAEWARCNSAGKLALYSMRGKTGAGIYSASEVICNKDGTSMNISDGDTSVRCSTRLAGRCNAVHVLAAATTLHTLGVPLADAVAALATAPPVPGRMEVFSTPGRPTAVVDYAHNPEALQAVLRDLRSLTSGRLWCVFGCGGDRDKGKRPVMGGVAERLADQIIITSDNPRSEDPVVICRDILSGVTDKGVVQQIIDRRQAIEHALRVAAETDIVLVAGKGHESVQIVAGREIPCDDRALVKELLPEGVS